MAITLDGTNGITSPDVTSDGLTVDSTTLVVDETNNRVGIGTSSPSQQLDVVSTSGFTPIRFKSQYSQAGLLGTDNSAIWMGVGSDGLTTRYRVDSADVLTMHTNSTERMRIDSSGALLVGRTSGNGSGKIIIQQNDNSNDNSYSGLDIYKGSSTTTTAQVFQRFFISNGGGGSGSITANGVAAATFTAYSDRRLKENIQDLSPQLENICNLKPVEFDYIGCPEGQGHQIGFVAQEMQEVYPDVVAAGENDMLQIAGWSKTEARLVKAIQELSAKNDALEARIAALEGAQA